MNKINFSKYIQGIREKYNLPDIKSTQNHRQHLIDAYNNKQGNLNNIDGYNCTECKNKGNIMVLIDGYEYSRECKCMKVRQVIKNMNNSGLGNMLKDYTLDTYLANEDFQKEIKNKAIKYLNDNSNKWWYISGQSGCGKTHISTAICNKFLKNYHVVKYMRWANEINEIKSAKTNDSQTYKNKMSEITKAEILYIDDFLKPIKNQDGKKCMPTIADTSLAFDLIDYRKNSDLKTIISSERSIQELLNIDEATAGRIIEKTTKEYILHIEPNHLKNQRLKQLI